MKLQNVPLDQIVSNPWRDESIHPVDKEHVAELCASIHEHGFFGGLKGRRANGKVQLGCGHARIAAARKAKLDSVPIYIDDIDDDAMLRLMTDENATQAGSSAGAVINEVSAVIRRLIEGLLGGGGTIVPPVAKAFDNKTGIEQARIKIRNGNAHVALGHNVIRTYLGQGNPKNALRGERQIREALAALKQSGRYDEIIDEVVSQYPIPVSNVPPAKNTEVTTTRQPKPRQRLLDERSASIFKNDHQFHAFREAVTTSAAQKAIPVDKQFGLAKEIMREKRDDFSKKQVGAPYIKAKVQERVQDYMKEQRKIDKEERDRYLAEQIEEQINAELHTANASLRSLISALLKLERLAEKFPAHPKLGGFAARLDDLVNSIKQFSRKLK
jgi:ParB-like nuclease domain